MTIFRPGDWFWIVAGDDTRAWSSAAGAYVTDWPDDQVTRIASEAELNDVLARYNLVGPLIAADQVRAEAQRRIIALTGATSLIETIVKQSNANMRANELNDKRLSGETLTTAEQAEADALRSLADAIKAIREASNVMEANPPANYADDENWP